MSLERKVTPLDLLRRKFLKLTAIVRDPARFTLSHDRLTVVVGQVVDD